MLSEMSLLLVLEYYHSTGPYLCRGGPISILVQVEEDEWNMMRRKIRPKVPEEVE